MLSALMQHTVTQRNSLLQDIIFQLLGCHWMKDFKMETNCWGYKDPTGLCLLTPQRPFLTGSCCKWEAATSGPTVLVITAVAFMSLCYSTLK